MRVTVLTFHPETLEIAAERVRTLLAGSTPELDYVYPSVIFSPEDDWPEDMAQDVAKRFKGLPQDIRVLHIKPADFMSELLGHNPPALVVVAYTHWSERVSMTANMLAVRNFPTLVLGYRA